MDDRLQLLDETPVDTGRRVHLVLPAVGEPLWLTQVTDADSGALHPAHRVALILDPRTADVSVIVDVICDSDDQPINATVRQIPTRNTPHGTVVPLRRYRFAVAGLALTTS